MREKRWILPEKPPDWVEAALADYPPIHRQILFRRGITSATQAERFLAGSEPEVSDPMLLNGMDRAVRRLAEGIQSRERIVIYGDYDADGVTASALLVEGLEKLGASVKVYFPNRIDEGYGLNREAMKLLAGQGAQLIVSVDCGMRALDEVELANRLGLDVIITDHHHPGASLPPAYAIVNPLQPGDAYPFKSLAGVGLAYKLLMALIDHLGQAPADGGLDLVALGTVADLATLEGENRYLVRQGLRAINATRRPGLLALMETSGHKPGHVDAAAIGFGLGPRINAAGRIESAYRALELLLAHDMASAQPLAEALDAANRKRQALTQLVVERAESKWQDREPPNVLLSADPEFHEGVVGLAAARLAERFHRPAIVGRMGERSTRASARSIEGFHITEALEECGHLLLRFGGHAAAAGMEIPNENLPMLEEKLELLFEERADPSKLDPELQIDAVVSFEDLVGGLLEFQDNLAPFGMGNPMPALCTPEVEVMSKRTVGAGGKHLKLMLKQGGRPFDAIAFRMGDRTGGLPGRIDVVYHLERNHYLGYETLQLNVQDLRPAASLEA